MFEIIHEEYTDVKAYFENPTFLAITIYSEESFDAYTRCIEDLFNRGYCFLEETSGAIPDIPVYVNSALLICEDKNYKGIESRIVRSTEKYEAKSLIYSKLHANSSFINYTFTGNRTDYYKNILKKYETLKSSDTGTFWFYDADTCEVYSKLTGVLVFGNQLDLDKFEEEIGGMDA